MKRYWLFVYSTYYPNGGLLDLVKTFDTEDEAIAYSKGINDDPLENYHIFDAQEENIIKAKIDNLDKEVCPISYIQSYHEVF